MHILRAAGDDPLRSALLDGGIRLTLIARDAKTPYSGMLPGYVAGHYVEEQMHIDLRALCNWSGVRFVEASATAVEYYGKGNEGDEDGAGAGVGGLGVVHCSDGRPPIKYDALGIDVGSSSGGFFESNGNEDRDGCREGASASSITTVKPISTFTPRWLDLTSQLQETATNYTYENPFFLVVVGGGAGGVEMALSAQCALEKVLSDFGAKGGAAALKVTLATRGDELLTGHSSGVRKIFKRILKEKKVDVRYKADATGVKNSKGGSGEDEDDGDKLRVFSVVVKSSLVN